MNNLNDLNKDVIAIELTFENCEHMEIPINCFKRLNYQLDQDNNIINLDCIIENDGSINNLEDPFSSPLDRIYKRNDICDFDFIYRNNPIKKHKILWWRDSNPFIIAQDNKNQFSKKLRYNTIKIYVQPYTPKYTLNELFKFPPETTFKDEENNKYKMKLNSLGKYIDIPMTEKYVNMKYTLCMDSKIEKELISYYDQNN